MNSTSARFEINGMDMWKAFRSFLVISLSLVILNGINTLVPSLLSALPAKYAILMPVITFLVELIRRWATDHSK